MFSASGKPLGSFCIHNLHQAHFFGGNYAVFLATIVGLGNGSFEMYTAKNHIHVKVDGSSQVHVSEILLHYRYPIGHLVN